MKERNIDIVFCLDKTGWMGYLINHLADEYEHIIEHIIQSFEEADGSIVKQIRVKVIAFGDYEYDEEPMVFSGFFDAVKEREEVINFLRNIETGGGGDLPESGFEALALAMESNWVTGEYDRQMILFFTDADAKEFADGTNYMAIPDCEARSINDVRDYWSGNDHRVKINNRLKRMYIVAPSGTAYEEMCFDKTYFKEVPTDNRSIWEKFGASFWEKFDFIAFLDGR